MTRFSNQTSTSHLIFGVSKRQQKADRSQERAAHFSIRVHLENAHEGAKNEPYEVPIQQLELLFYS